MSKVSNLHKQWLQTPEYQAAYQELEPEFELARLLIETRTKAGLMQPRKSVTSMPGDRAVHRCTTQ